MQSDNDTLVALLSLQLQAPSSTSKDTSSASDEDRNVKMMTLVNIGNNILGLLVMIVLSNWWSNHLQQLHENDMWFSNIEVSFC